jgi:hypothetical protein
VVCPDLRGGWHSELLYPLRFRSWGQSAAAGLRVDTNTEGSVRTRRARNGRGGATAVLPRSAPKISLPEENFLEGMVCAIFPDVAAGHRFTGRVQKRSRGSVIGRDPEPTVAIVNQRLVTGTLPAAPRAGGGTCPRHGDLLL